MQNMGLARNQLSNSLPLAWSALEDLSDLSLKGNKLTGPLPVQWSNLGSLVILALSDNLLTGSMPVEWIKIGANVKGQDESISNSSAVQPGSGSGPRVARSSFCHDAVYMEDMSLDGGAFSCMDLSHNKLTGTLHTEWGSWKGLRAVYMLHNNLSGTLPPSWRGMEQLSHLHLSGNSLSGPLPPSWKEMSSLQILNITDQRGVGFSGGMPSGWRRFCLQEGPRMAWCSSEQSLHSFLYHGHCSVELDNCSLPVALYGLQFLRRGVVPFTFANEYFFQDTNWRCNACIYPHSFTVAATLSLMLQPVLLLMVIVGMCKRLAIKSKATKRLPDQQPRANVSASSRSTASSTYAGSIFNLVKFCVVVGGAVVTDVLVLADIWGSAAGYTLLVTMLLPHAVCAVALGVCFSRAPKQSALAGAAGEVTSNLSNPPQQGNAPRAIGWVEQELEGALSSLFTPGLNAWWNVICCALLLVVWPVIAVVLLPLGAWVKGSSSIWADVIPTKSSSSSSSSIRHNQAILRQLQPQRLVVLYYWFAAVFEASTSLVLISVLLVMGVQPRFGYVVESTRLLYASLAFSVLHLLVFTWDMIMCLALSQSKQQWVAALVWPFKVACVSHRDGLGGKEENLESPAGADGDADAYLEMQPLTG